MKELTVDFSEFNSNIIYFKANFYYEKNIFLENKNFKTIPRLGIPIKGCYFHLDYNLNLKQFKMEISE